MFASALLLSLISLTTPYSQAATSDLASLSTKDFSLGTAPTGCMPKGAKIDGSGQYLYLAEMCGKIDPVTKKRIPTASIYDMNKRSLYKTLVTPVGMTDGILANTEVDFSLDEKWAFISRAEGDSNSEVYKNFGLLTVVNTQTQKIAKYIPTHGEGSKIITARPYLTNDSSRQQILYVANYFSDDISVIDVTHLKEDGNLDGSQHLIARIRLHSQFKNAKPKSYLIAPRGIAFTPNGKFAFILATETGSIIVMDAVNHKQVAELAPMSKETAGREVNVRHIVITKDGKTAYLSHMHGNAISRIDIPKLVQKIQALPINDSQNLLPATVWEEILIPFPSARQSRKILVLENYPKDHPNFPGSTWSLAHPNTIALDRATERYLYVSFRTTSTEGDTKVDPSIKGKIDIIDTKKGEVVFSLVGGSQPTALEVSKDRILVSSGFIDSKLYFFDVKKILELYEK